MTLPSAPTIIAGIAPIGGAMEARFLLCPGAAGNLSSSGDPKKHVETCSQIVSRKREEGDLPKKKSK
jgi:hypothetical protein